MYVELCRKPSLKKMIKSPLAQQLQAKGVLLPKCLVFTLKRIKDPEMDPTRQCLLLL